MTSDAGHTGGNARRARRPGPVVATAAAVLLLLGGGTAVAVGLSDQDATPPPLAVSTSTPEPSAAPSATPSSTPTPTPVPSSAAPAPAPTPTPTPTEAPAPAALPVSINIPAIGVSSDLIHLGLDAEGAIAVPQGDSFDTAAWFDGSPRPGDLGPAVIEGHVSSAARGPSVFFDLARISVGDTIDVTREDGSTVSFEVYKTAQFPKDDFPTLAVYGNTDGPELRVITCGGTIIEDTGHFDDNVIVYARLV